MNEKYPQASEEESENFPEQAHKEVISAHQQEVKRRFNELAEYIKSSPDDLPDKDLLAKLSQGIGQAIDVSINTTPERAHEELLANLDYALRPLGYNAINKIQQFKLEARSSLRGNEPWLQTEAAARQELDRLRPWAERGIGDERENAKAYAEVIYDRFPNLRKSE